VSGWFSRPVLFVSSVERAMEFYCERLGFTESNRYVEEGTVLVGEVSREDCILLLNCQQPEKFGKARMFIALEPGTLDALRTEFDHRSAPAEDGWWG
jgi:catechol 2,3-dioxygenase-like lactoylglutathione lyase family enzyme